MGRQYRPVVNYKSGLKAPSLLRCVSIVKPWTSKAGYDHLFKCSAKVGCRVTAPGGHLLSCIYFLPGIEVTVLSLGREAAGIVSRRSCCDALG